VATSALRESNNGQLFRELVKSATGWRIEVISSVEQGRLVHLAVAASLRKCPSRLLLIDVESGSLQLVFSISGHIRDIVSLPLGSVRLTQEFLYHDPPTDKEIRRLEEYIGEELANIPRRWSRFRDKVVIATSETAAALSVAIQSLGLSPAVVPLAVVNKFARRLSKMDTRQRATIEGIGQEIAETAVAGATVYAHILTTCRLKSFIYSPVGLRDGILAQMAAEYDSRGPIRKQLESAREDMLLNICRRYGVDQANAEHTRNLAWSLFDQTRTVHRLPKEFREWIGAAAMLYEVGTYVNPIGKYQNAHFIISRCELFGFTPSQRQIIATIARYQGPSAPQLQDRLIKVLPVHVRSDVIKSTAILRLARVLNQGRRGAVRQLQASFRNGQMVIGIKLAPGGADLELWAGQKEIPSFRAVFGLEVVIRSDSKLAPKI
jgi:exopolyphosphatase/guanosine-5'-triphosphate,3'-diphosphate pyrophosphatase